MIFYMNFISMKKRKYKKYFKILKQIDIPNDMAEMIVFKMFNNNQNQVEYHIDYLIKKHNLHLDLIKKLKIFEKSLTENEKNEINYIINYGKKEKENIFNIIKKIKENDITEVDNSYNFFEKADDIELDQILEIELKKLKINYNKQ